MPVRLLTTMTSRDPDEPHRASTPLELFFDLTFVVAVAQASSTMHHLLVGGDAGDALVAFPLVFFAIWWAWMNFTWFASAYDPDDAAFRLLVFAQMAGVLVFASGVPRFLEDLDPSVAVAGYVIMRVSAVAQWLRAAAQDPVTRAGALRYAAGVAACQVGWVALVAVQTALDEGGPFRDLLTTAVGGFLVVAAMWWIYFDLPVERLLTRARTAFSALEETQSFVWGYGHYLIFASAAAVGVGLAVAADQAVGHSSLTDLEAALVLTVPVAVFLVTVWALHWRFKAPGPLRTIGCPLTTAAVLAASWTGEPVLLSGLALAALVAVSLLRPEGTA